jgi:1-acyl-sn-glycerol-3-phosphate acyltransferase
VSKSRGAAKPRSKSARSEKTFGWRIVAGIVIPPLRLAAKFRILDGNKVPRTGAFVLSPNHYSEIDPIIMGYAMWKQGRVPRFLAKASLFKIPVVGAVMRGTGQIPVERAGSSRKADPLAAAKLLVQNDSGVIVYPEGSLTRDPDLWPMRGKTGAVRLALTAGVPIIPAAHWGTQELMPRYGKRIHAFPQKKIDILFGDPVDLSAFAGRPLDNATLTEATAVVMADVTRLLEKLRNETAPAERWDPAKQNQKETGRFE